MCRLFVHVPRTGPTRAVARPPFTSTFTRSFPHYPVDPGSRGRHPNAERVGALDGRLSPLTLPVTRIQHTRKRTNLYPAEMTRFEDRRSALCQAQNTVCPSCNYNIQYTCARWRA